MTSAPFTDESTYGEVAVYLETHGLRLTRLKAVGNLYEATIRDGEKLYTCTAATVHEAINGAIAAAQRTPQP